MYSDYSNLL